VALLLNTERNAAMAIGLRVSSALGTLRANGVLSSVRLGLACAPVDAADAEHLLMVSRERAIKDGGSGIPPPEAIH
jgi:hypothetical protein